jgi:hypothetical protein
VPLPEAAPDITNRWAKAAFLLLTLTVHVPCIVTAIVIFSLGYDQDLRTYDMDKCITATMVNVLTLTIPDS